MLIINALFDTPTHTTQTDTQTDIVCVCMWDLYGRILTQIQTYFTYYLCLNLLIYVLF